jgi:hypothetical protein
LHSRPIHATLRTLAGLSKIRRGIRRRGASSGCPALHHTMKIWIGRILQ